MEHKGTKIIETQRLILRPFNNDDAESMYENWAKNTKVTQYLSWQPHENVEVTKNILKDWVSQYQNLGYYQWAIEESDQPIGSMGSV